MKFLFSSLLALMATLALALPGNSQAESLSDYTVSPLDDHGRIIGSLGKGGDNVMPVYFTYINGHRVTGQRDVLWLKPGEYEIEAAILSSGFQRKMVRATRRGPPSRRIELEPLQLVVEEGKSYRIGGLHLHRQEDSQRRAFRLVLWKVEGDDGDSHYPELPAVDGSEDDDGDDKS